MLLVIQAGKTALQGDLTLDEPDADRPGLMTAMDSLNDRFGRGSVALASAGLAGDRRSWVMKRDSKTPNYTTHWADMPVAGLSTQPHLNPFSCICPIASLRHNTYS